MKKALIISSVFGFLGSFEKNNINILNDLGYNVTCATNMSKELKNFGDVGQLDDCNISKIQVDFPRSPFSKNIIVSYRQLKKIFRENEFNLVHCHTPVASILTRIVAKNHRKSRTKVVYTAHGFHFFKGASKLSWVLYYPVEKFCARFTDVLVTINKEDYSLAKKKMKAKKIIYVPGVGVDTFKFSSLIIDSKEKREKLNVPKNSIVVLSVGELNKNKNHQIIIKALSKCNNKNIHYIIAGMGELNEYLAHMIDDLGISDRVHLIGYRNDLKEIYKSVDIFILPSIREGLSISLMEAMSAGLPCVVSKIRGNEDLIQNNNGGYLVNYDDIDKFAYYMDKLSGNKELCSKFGEYNKHYIQKFDVANVREIMKEIYTDITRS